MNRSTALVDGALAGIAGAGCMSVLRMAARRWGFVDLTPPQATKLRLLGHVVPRQSAAHHVLDAAIHIGVSAAGGAVYGAAQAVKARGLRRPALSGGALFGLALWATAFGVVAPALGITRAPWRGTWKETAVNLAAHLTYGASLALVDGELARQSSTAGVDVRGVRARVG